jgi:hypothetical protein
MSNYTIPTDVFRIPTGGEYGNNAAFRKGKSHKGVDDAVPIGTAVYAAIGGTVHSWGTNDVLGNWVVWHGDDGLYWSYSHLDRPATIRGRIESGDDIVDSGATGNVTGPHVHIACGTSVSVGVGHRDPMQYLRGALTPAARRAVRAAAVVPAAGSKPTAPAWKYTSPSREVCKRVQRALIAKGRLSRSYVVDGIDGPTMRKAVQTTLNVSKVFVGSVDGDIRGGGCLGIQKYAAKYGSYTGPLDSKPEDASWNGFALGLERP